MKLRYSYIWMLLFLLVGCDSRDNFFYQPVKFSGEVEDSHMVLIAKLIEGNDMNVWVGESRFFQERQEKVQQPLSDVTKILYVDGEKVDGMAPLEAGQKVRVEVSHPVYGRAWAEQTIPAPLSVEDTVLRASELRYDKDGFCYFPLTLPAYKGDSTDVICIRLTTVYTVRAYDVEDRLVSKSQYEESYVYGQDLGFAEFADLNVLQPTNYYGGNKRGLYLPASALREKKTIPMAVYMRQTHLDYNHIGTPPVDFIRMEIHVMSRDEYLRANTVFRNGGAFDGIRTWSSYVPKMGGEGVVDIVGDIKDIFNELGSMEDVQLYDNIEGTAIGYMGAQAVRTRYLVNDEFTGDITERVSWYDEDYYNQYYW